MTGYHTTEAVKDLAEDTLERVADLTKAKSPERLHDLKLAIRLFLLSFYDALDDKEVVDAAFDADHAQN